MTIDLQNLFFLILGGLFTLWAANRYSARRLIHFKSYGKSIFSSDSLDDVDGFEVRYKGHPVSYVNKHTIYVWNGGNKALWDSNFDTENPLHFEFESGSLLKIDEVVSVSDGIQWNPTIENEKFYPNFSVLDSGKGVSITVLETRGQPRDFKVSGFQWVQSPEVKGTVIDLTKPPAEKSIPSVSDVVSFLKFVFGCAGITAMIVATLTLFGVLVFAWPLTAEWRFGIGLAGGVIGFSIVISVIGKFKSKFSKVPKEFSQLELQNQPTATQFIGYTQNIDRTVSFLHQNSKQN